jgi:hypothetical protein
MKFCISECQNLVYLPITECLTISVLNCIRVMNSSLCPLAAINVYVCDK